MIESQLRRLGKLLSRGSLYSPPTVERTSTKKYSTYEPLRVEIGSQQSERPSLSAFRPIDSELDAARATVFARSPWKWDRRVESHHELLEPLAKTFLERKGVSSDAAIATIHVYVSDKEPEKLTDVLAALDACLRSVGAETDAVGPPISGSWYQVAVAVYRAAAKPLKKFKELIEHVQMLDTKKATANTKNAIALLEALNKTKSAAILVGPMLILKAKGKDGDRVVMKELSPKELQAISENSVLLQHPEKLMKLMEEAEVADTPTLTSTNQPKARKLPPANPPTPPQA